MYTTHSKSPFKRGANFYELLAENPIQFWCDFDNTLTEGHQCPSVRALVARAGIDGFLRHRGIMRGTITARKLGHGMGQEAYDASVAMGFDEPYPKSGKDPKTDLLVPIDHDKEPFYSGWTNWDIIGSLGGGFAVKHGLGYKKDKVFEQLLNYDHLDDAIQAIQHQDDYLVGKSGELGPSSWRFDAIAFVAEHFPPLLEFMPDIEFMARFLTGKADSPPQIGRLQFNLRGSEGLRLLREFLSLHNKKIHEGNRMARRLKISSEDKLHSTDSEQDVYVLYLLPWWGEKHRMFNWGIKHSIAATAWSVQDVLVAYGGDSVTDLDIMLRGGERTISVIPNGSRLVQPLLERWPCYGTRKLSHLWGNGVYEDRLRPTKWKGVWEFVHKIRGHRRNLLVIGDVRYPNANAPESVLYFMQEFLPKTRHRFGDTELAPQ